MRNKILGFAVLAVASVMVAAGTGAEAQETSRETQKTGGKAVGAEIVHPAAWNVEREPYTYEDTYGYTLWYPDTEAAHDHGGRPALRVALAYDLDPEDIEAEVEGLIADYPDLSLGRETVDVAREHEGVAVGLVPGSTPYTAVYVPVNGRVYSINVYAEDPNDGGLGAADKALLQDLRFEPPAQEEIPAGLPAANSAQEIYPSGDELRRLTAPGEVKGSAVTEQPDAAPSGPTLDGRAAARGGGEERIAEGCWRADPGYYVQTQHGSGANRSRDENIPTGWTRIGLPNFWGQYTHGNFGYGRCDEPDWANDKYAVDYPLSRGNYVFSPFACGTVKFAGRNKTHADYGIFVSIRACNDKYVNLSAHLDAVAIKRNGERLRPGDRVTEDTVIGYAGDSGGSVAVGRVHLHTTFYRLPETHPDGSPYGGAGLQVVRNRYVGTAARREDLKVRSNAYVYDRVRPDNGFCREGIRCGEGYLVSN